MTTITTKLAPSRLRYDGDINVGNGQLGLHANMTGSITNLNLVPSGNLTQYFASYFISVSASASSLTLPPIGTGVQIGWKARIYYNFVYGFTTFASILTIRDSSSNTIYSINGSIRKGVSPSYTDTTQVLVVTAIGPGVNDWYIETIAPSTSTLTYLLGYSPVNNGLITYPIGQLGKFFTRPDGTTNINVPIITPVVISFDVTPLIISSFIYYKDVNYYTSTATTVTFVKTGSYALRFIITLNVTGGGITTNCEFIIRRNGTTFIPAFCVPTIGSLSSTSQYLLKSYFTATAGDFIEILGGKSITTSGTVMVSIISHYFINCIGS